MGAAESKEDREINTVAKDCELLPREQAIPEIIRILELKELKRTSDRLFKLCKL